MHRHECNTHNHLFKCLKSFKIVIKFLFYCSLYLQPEIGRCDIGLSLPDYHVLAFSYFNLM
jgi:hypothetical protein